MTTDKQQQEFRNIVEDSIELTILSSSLENSIEWIRNNLQPEDIFPQLEIERAARALGMEYNDKN